MPAKMARSAPRPPFGPSEVTVAVRNSLLSCRKAGKPRTSAPIRESSGESRLERAVPVSVLSQPKIDSLQPRTWSFQHTIKPRLDTEMAKGPQRQYTYGMICSYGADKHRHRKVNKM